MRDLTATALSQIAEKFGNEPITILDIAWRKGGSELQYADRKLGSIEGKILEVSALDSVITANAGQSQSISVTLDDTDGSLKAILDTADIHQRDVWVYQTFDGLDLADRFLLFRGQITSPVTYSEGDRTLSFTVLSQVEDKEIGFSAEEGDFSFIAENLIGKPWPMNFGTTVYGKTLKLDTTQRGILANDMGTSDFSLQTTLDLLNDLVFRCELHRANHQFWSNRAAVDDDAQEAARQQSVADQYEQFKIQYFDQASNVASALSSQVDTELSSFRVFGGEEFPRGNISLKIDDVVFTGVFQGDGDTFQVLSRTHPLNNADFTLPFSTGQSIINHINQTSSLTFNILGDSANYVFHNAGTQVELVTNEGQGYVVSITPGTVKAVAAYLNNNGVRKLVNVPADYYTVETRTYRGVEATILTMIDALSKVPDATWEDEIFVTFESDIGPNTVDVLEYLIDKYTEYTYDSTTFNSVKTALVNYPSHFQILQRKQVLQALEEISWQARCSIWLSNGVFFLRYLAVTPTSVATITDSDVDVGSLEVGFTPTEDIVTKFIASWRATGAQENDNTVILRHNVPKYGTKERDFDFYIYNNVDLVIKAATFWLIRYANTWKRASFRTPLNLLNVESLDGITLDFASNWIANEAVVGIAEQADYDSNSAEVIFDVWTPVKAGRMVAYDFAYPAAVDVDVKFPTEEDDAENFDTALSENEGLDGNLGVSTGNISVRYVGGDNDSDPFRLGPRRASDRGQISPTDEQDGSPGTIVIPALANLVTQVAGPASPTSDPINLATSSDGSLGSSGEIDIHSTSIFDSTTGERTTLDKFFESIDTDKNLNVKSEVTVSDGDNVAPMKFRRDEELDLYGADLAFLYEPEEPE